MTGVSQREMENYQKCNIGTEVKIHLENGDKFDCFVLSNKHNSVILKNNEDIKYNKFKIKKYNFKNSKVLILIMDIDMKLNADLNSESKIELDTNKMIHKVKSFKIKNF